MKKISCMAETGRWYGGILSRAGQTLKDLSWYSPARYLSAFTASFVLLTTEVLAQGEIPVGTWRAHISFNTIHSLAVGDEKVYGAARNGVMVLDRAENSLTSFSKLDGLRGTGISSINFDQSTGQLLIGYEDGKIDVIIDNKINGFDPAQYTPITGSTKINHIAIRSGFAYLSADYGVVVFDLARAAIKETWRDLGAGGKTLEIYQSTFKGDSIFLATENGVIAGDLDNNLLDFNKWKRFVTNDFSGAIKAIAAFNNKVYAAINGSGIHCYEYGRWRKESFLDGASFQSLNASSNHLLISENINLWKLNSADQLTQVVDDKITLPLTAFEDPGGKLWIGDEKQGLVSDVNGSFASYRPNGPSTSAVLRLKYTDTKMYMVSGGFSETFQPLGMEGTLNVFENAAWQQISVSVLDLTDISFSASGKRYVSSFGYGVEARDLQGNVNLYNETNSSLINLNPPGRFVNITAIENSSDGLWVANYGAGQPLHRLKDDNSWEAFSFPITASRYPTAMAVDLSGYVWMVLNPLQGGGMLVFDRRDNQYDYITEQDGSGELPSESVRSIAVDRDGYVWVGTDLGVAYFYNPSDDAVKPIFESRFLLKDDKVTAIAVDGGNRKWMGTERGVWLFNSTGEELIYNFTAENSPLLSNVIRDIEIDGATGEVFFATDKGIVSFRADATESTSAFQGIKIFPNPVTRDFSGTVGITGLATDAIVKITDVSGKLIWQTKANGGTATWNVQDYKGKRAITGIYLVFAASPDGAESAIGKIAVVD